MAQKKPPLSVLPGYQAFERGDPVLRSVLLLLLFICCVLLSACSSRQTSAGPSIKFTRIPLADKGGTPQLDSIEGRVMGARPGQQVVLYARSGAWYVQPFADQQFTTIQPDSTWKASTHLGTEYAALLGPIHAIMRNLVSLSGLIEFFPAHPHEGGVGVPQFERHARVIATGTSLVTGRSFNLVVAFERNQDDRGNHLGRAVAESSFHHFVDYNWDIDHGCPSFVAEPPGHGIEHEPDKLEDVKTYVRNLALWLAPAETEETLREASNSLSSSKSPPRWTNHYDG